MSSFDSSAGPSGKDASQSDRLRAPETTPLPASTAPGEPTPTPDERRGVRHPPRPPPRAGSPRSPRPPPRVRRWWAWGGAPRRRPRPSRRSPPPGSSFRRGRPRPRVRSCGHTNPITRRWGRGAPACIGRPFMDRMDAVASVFGIDVGGTKVAVGAVDGAAVTHDGGAPHRRFGCRGAARRDPGRGGGGGRRWRASRRRSASACPPRCDFATGTVLASVNIPLAGLPLRQELADALRRARVRGQRRQLRGPGRGPPGARPARALPRDAHARHRGGRRRDHRRADLPRCHRPGRRARPRGDRRGGRGRPSARARRFPASRLARVVLQRHRARAARPTGARGRDPTAGSGASSRRRDDVSGRDADALAREGDQSRARSVRLARQVPRASASQAWSTPSSPSTW